jgi:flavin reductase (DIM6/NTAB) family NADH-FMN oxidoreductase RutF
VSSAFTRIVQRLDYPMFVVTAADGDERSGCLVGFATQCSIKPARFLVCISEKNHTFGLAGRSDTLVVHVLGDDELGLAELFGGETGDEVDKFAGCTWRPGPGGAPVLEGAAAWFAGRVLERVAFGDHTGFVLEPLEGADDSFDGGELSYQQVEDLDPGHAP